MTAETTTQTTDAAGLLEIEPVDLHSMLDRGEAIVIDVREADEYARDHIDGALLVPLSAFDAAKVPADNGRTVVLHCRSGRRSADAANRLLAAGRPVARHLRGGILAWREAGFPVVENKRVPISIMRQVQITAGSLVVLGVLLAIAFHPLWALLSGFVGAGLVFAGVTGTCGLAAVLARMPWNRPLRAATTCCSTGAG